MLEIGEYRAQSKTAALGKTQGGKEQIAVTFDLLDLPGQSITWYGYFTETSEETTFRGPRAAGCVGDDLADLSSLQPGAEVVLVIDHETYEGKTRAKVKFVNSGSGGIPLKSQLAPDAAKSFAARMKGRLLAFDRTAGTPAQPKPAPRHAASASSEVPQEVLDRQAAEQSDEIPF